MALYRKRPVTIEARELTRENAEELQDWVGSTRRNDAGIVVPTLEGEHQANWGDFIIEGVHGEHYPCKPDIFAKTYEAVEE